MIKFRDNSLKIVENTPSHIKYTHNGEEYIISKESKTDNPCAMTWDMFEFMDADVTVHDGYAESADGRFYCTFPTLKETFSNKKNLNDALYYRMEHEDCGWFDDILGDLNLWDIFEGYYFSGRLDNVKMVESHEYEMVACIIESEDMGEEARADYEAIENGEDDAVERLLKYKVESNTTEFFINKGEYVIDTDADGVYLFKMVC